MEDVDAYAYADTQVLPALEDEKDTTEPDEMEVGEGEEERNLGEAAAIETLAKASTSRPEALKSAYSNATSAERRNDAAKRRKTRHFDVLTMEKGRVESPAKDREIGWEERSGALKL